MKNRKLVEFVELHHSHNLYQSGHGGNSVEKRKGIIKTSSSNIVGGVGVKINDGKVGSTHQTLCFAVESRKGRKIILL